MTFISCRLVAQLKVEAIKTTKDVLVFLNQYYLRKNGLQAAPIDYYRNKNFRNSVSDKETFKYFDSQNTNHWIKADFNKDGDLDLLWNGCIDKAATILAFISDINGYNMTVLSDLAESETLHLIKPYKTDGFILTRINPESVDWDTSYHFKDRFACDTVTFYKNYFVEYNTLNKRHKVDTLFYSRRGIFDFKDDTITINKDGEILNSIYIRTDTGTIHMLLSKRLSADSLKLFFSIADNLPFYCLDSYYSYVANPIRDASTHHLEFVFEDGTRQKISAYHNTAPFGIKVLIDWIKKIEAEYIEVVNK